MGDDRDGEAEFLALWRDADDETRAAALVLLRRMAAERRAALDESKH